MFAFPLACHLNQPDIFFEQLIHKYGKINPLGGGDGNLYAYVGNDPVNWIDPDGQLPSLPDWLIS